MRRPAAPGRRLCSGAPTLKGPPGLVCCTEPGARREGSGIWAERRFCAGPVARSKRPVGRLLRATGLKNHRFPQANSTGVRSGSSDARSVCAAKKSSALLVQMLTNCLLTFHPRSISAPGSTCAPLGRRLQGRDDETAKLLVGAIETSGPTVWHSAAASALGETFKMPPISRAKRSAATPHARERALPTRETAHIRTVSRQPPIRHAVCQYGRNSVGEFLSKRRLGGSRLSSWLSVGTTSSPTHAQSYYLYSR
jgi:hypothetical protein